VQVGAAIVASRHAVAEVPPFTLAMWRYAIGLACLLPFAHGEWRALRSAEPLHGRRRDLAAMAALGIGQFGVLIALLNFGLQEVDAARAALVFSIFPLLTLLLSAGLGQERVTLSLLGGVALSLAGVACVLVPRVGASSEFSWRGVAFVALAALTGAVCSVLYRPYLRRYPTVAVSALAMAASVGVLAVLAASEGLFASAPRYSAGAWTAVVFVGLSSGVGYFWWLYALKHESPARVTVFLALNPATAAVLSWLLLGESAGAAGLAALVLIALGLWLAARR
jgi:drug/metabolite transporter (DMT)-like permease